MMFRPLTPSPQLLFHPLLTPGVEGIVHRKFVFQLFLVIRTGKGKTVGNRPHFIRPDKEILHFLLLSFPTEASTVSI